MDDLVDAFHHGRESVEQWWSSIFSSPLPEPPAPPLRRSYLEPAVSSKPLHARRSEAFTAAPARHRSVEEREPLLCNAWVLTTGLKVSWLLVALLAVLVALASGVNTLPMQRRLLNALLSFERLRAGSDAAGWSRCQPSGGASCGCGTQWRQLSYCTPRETRPCHILCPPPKPERPPPPDCFRDCRGRCAHPATALAVDDCGVCGGANRNKDCLGVCFGAAKRDCKGTCNGTAVVDGCGVCDGGNRDMGANGRCFAAGVPDCAGVFGGKKRLDECGVCGGRSQRDCAGVCFGTAKVDCTGVCGGSAVKDDCGVCGGDNRDKGCDGRCFSKRVPDCAGVCGGRAKIDSCGVCNGRNRDLGCDGRCFSGAVEGLCGCRVPNERCGACGCPGE